MWLTFDWSNGNSGPTLFTDEDGLYSVEISTVCEARVFEFEVIDDLLASEQFRVPNVFTPNGDGVNDTFGPVTRNMPELFEFFIFDRWGNKVFQSNGERLFWDGTWKGKPAISDVYIWRMFAAYDDCEGTPVSFDLKGDVTLIR